MKKAILLISFGTTYVDAAEASLGRIERELKEASGGIPVFPAYTSGMVIRALAGRGIHVDTVEEAAERAKQAGAESLYAVMTHMIPGREYQKAVEQLEKCRKEFQEIYAASPVLGREEDCGALIPVLREILGLEEGREYILMGHGTDDAANIRYVQMNEAFENAGLPRLRIASVESRPDLEDAMRALAQKRKRGKVLVHPFLVVAGDHARNDMAGTDDSYVTRLREAGYEVEAVVKGLGEYAQFRKIYADRLMEMLQNGSGRMEEEA